MSIFKFLFFCLIFTLLFVSIVQAHESKRYSFDEQKIDCGAECVRRCRLSSRPNLCHRACGTCCARCNCVPPGTYGNYETCPCYASLTTHGGRKKCP
ncbi:hypothetical protein ACJIZ3_014250 [Penstemon smallii]|uniref:Snakin-2 n=1 Tax=Penstemon smallii TaxID=265156 RepID=A0ABD3RJ05_9LAMI